MLQITDNAQAHLIRVRQERGLDDRQAARFVGSDGRVRLTFAAASLPGDREVSTKEIRVFVATEIADRLDQAIIDARREDGKDGLVIRKATRPASS